MKSVDIRCAARRFAPFCLALAGLWLALPLRAQTYHNLVNQKFRTVSNGPQSVIVVDVPDMTDAVAVRKAALAKFQASAASQRPALKQQIALMRKRHLIRSTQKFEYVQVAMARSNGRLAMPAQKQTRAVPGTNDIKFNFPTSGDGAWSLAEATSLNTLANTILKPEMRTILGPPLWSDTPNSGLATVTVLNLDPFQGKVDDVLYALIVISTDANNNPVVQIQMPGGLDDQTAFLVMAQAEAQAFVGPYRIGYDAWAQGMARAATVIAAKDISTYTNNGVTTTLDPTNGYYYTPNYDLDNQPALGNDTFTPPTKSNQSNQTSATTLAGMLIPRMQMSSVAWLKCYIENNNFFSQFYSAYHDAFQANTNTRNDVNALRTIAKSVLPTVEGLAFDTWYEQQYVLDTSVTVGPKLYAYTFPSLPEDPSDPNAFPAGAVIWLVYYNTSLTSSGQGDETDLSATVNPIYWDYNFANRLFPAIGSDPFSIVNGFGAIAPTFENLGANGDAMRLTMDFPAAREYVRVPFPANETGPFNAYNDYSGVLVGADGGTMTLLFGNGSSKTVNVTQGAFGGTGAPTNLFSKDTFTLNQGGTITTFRRNTFWRSGAPPVFKFVAPAPVTTLTNVFPNGPRMISLPIRPIVQDLAKALGTDPATLLLAQYRQDLTTAQKYQLYPSLPTYQPGYGLWSNLNQNLQSTIAGNPTDLEQDISVPLLFGWNQIGSPYNVTPGLNVTTADISFSYRGSDIVSLADAVQAQWVSAGIVAYSPTSGYVTINDPNGTSDPTVPQNTLEPWKGYWIRVNVTEGLTIIYSNPSNRSAKALKLSRAISKSKPRDVGGWSMPLLVRDANGTASGAVFGQSSKGASSFNSSLDVASPPVYSRAATLAVRFPHADWDTGNGIGGDFLTDIRQTNTRAEWDINVSLPADQQPYTLNWLGSAKVPRGTRLTLVDKSTGTRTLMNTKATYAFTPAKGELTRQFQIIAEPRTANSLIIRNVVVDRPANAGSRGASSAVIHYELSSDAQTTVVIRQGGTIIRHLAAAGRAVQAGTNELVWDLRNDHGVGMTTGLYTLEITAQSTEGERARTILPINITR